MQLTDASVGVSKAVRRNTESEAGENVILPRMTERSIDILTFGRAITGQTLRLRTVSGASVDPVYTQTVVCHQQLVDCHDCSVFGQSINQSMILMV